MTPTLRRLLLISGGVLLAALALLILGSGLPIWNLVHTAKVHGEMNPLVVLGSMGMVFVSVVAGLFLSWLAGVVFVGTGLYWFCRSRSEEAVRWLLTVEVVMAFLTVGLRAARHFILVPNDGLRVALWAVLSPLLFWQLLLLTGIVLSMLRHRLQKPVWIWALIMLVVMFWASVLTGAASSTNKIALPKAIGTGQAALPELTVVPTPTASATPDFTPVPTATP